MNPLLAVTIVFVASVVIGLPLSFGLIASALAGLYFSYDSLSALDQLSRVAGSEMDFIIVSLPLYILLGELFMYSGVGAAGFRAAEVWLRRVPGGLGVAVIGASAPLAAVMGDTLASITTFGPTALAEAKRVGYSRKIVLGALAASGTLGILIPPSITMILYSAATGVSVGELFMAGFIPGLVLCLMMSAYIIWADVRERGRAASGPALATAAPEGDLESISHPPIIDGSPSGASSTLAASPPTTALTLAEATASPATLPDVDRAPVAAAADAEPSRLRLTLGAIPALVSVVIVLGSIYAGFATPTESAALGVMYALVLSMLVRRKGRGKEFLECLARAARTSSMLLFLIVGAQLLSQVLVLENVPQDMGAFLTGLDIGRWGVFILVVLGLSVLGTVMNPGPIVLITMPLIFPVVEGLGFDGVWFGIIVVIICELATLTPPIGVNLNVVQGISDASFEEVMRASLPFQGVLVAAITLFTLIPEIVLWLPQTLK